MVVHATRCQAASEQLYNLYGQRRRQSCAVSESGEVRQESPQICFSSEMSLKLTIRSTFVKKISIGSICEHTAYVLRKTPFLYVWIL